jgi:elongation factor G
MEEIDVAAAGDIVAMFGIECASGDTFTDESILVSMSSMHVPDPVISLAIKVDQASQANLAKAIGRFTREDPTFRTKVDQESG